MEFEKEIVVLDDDTYVWYWDYGYYDEYKPIFLYNPVDNIFETIKSARAQLNDSILEILFDEEISTFDYNENKESYCELFFVLITFFSVDSYTARLLEIKSDCKFIERIDPSRINEINCFKFDFEGYYICDASNDVKPVLVEITGIESDEIPSFNIRMNLINDFIFNKNTLKLSDDELESFILKKVSEPEKYIQYELKNTVDF